MSLNLASLLTAAAARHPRRPAVILGDAVLDFATLEALSRRFAGVLRGLGVARGQHVALLLPNVPWFSVAYWGAQMAGNPVVPLNVLLTGPEVAYHLQDSDSVVIIAWEGMAAAALAAAEKVPSCRVVVVTADRAAAPPDGALAFFALMAAADPIDDLAATMPDDPAVLLYTSGTTGAAKGAQLSHFNMYYNAEYSGTRLLPLGPETVALVTLPLFHSFGQTVMHNAVLARGGCLVLLPRFEPIAALTLMDKHRVTFFGGVPTMYFALLHHPDAGRFDLSALTLCVSGGAAMPVEVMRAFDERHGVNILEGYGLSETSPVASFNVLDRPKKPGSVGLPLEGVSFRLTDPSGARITAAGVAGEIEIKGHNVMLGYYRRPQATAEVLVDGWFKTGDIAIRDEDGYYFIVDRSKDLIIRGGFNVYPREVEEVLYGHPAIGEAAVIGQPDERLGEEIVAVVALKPGAAATADELIAHCKERLAPYKLPRVVRFVDALPKGPTGKILKRELRG
jgi:long-chain acyl-CoA synthetase